MTTSDRYWSVRIRELFNRLQTTDYLMLVLLTMVGIAVVYLAVLGVSSAVTPVSTGVFWLKAVNLLLIASAILSLARLIALAPMRRRILLLVLIIGAVWFGGNQFVANLTDGLMSSELETQVPILLLLIGLLGASVAASQLTQNRWRQDTTAHFLNLGAFGRPMPSFTGTGSLLTISLLRVTRDKLFLIYLGVFIVVLLSRFTFVDWSGNWVAVAGMGLAGLSALTVALLTNFSADFKKRFAHLPTGFGQIGLTGYFAGLAILLAVALIVCWGALGLTSVNTLQIAIATGSGFGAGFFLRQLIGTRQESGLFDWFWQAIFQFLTFGLVFVYSLRVSVPDAMMLSLFIMFLAVTRAFYQTRDASVTIQS